MRFGSFFVVTVAAGALVGWFAPHGSNPPRNASPDNRLDVAQSGQWRPEKVVLPRGDDGHFYAEVSASSGSVMMLVDTGATVVALTANDAAMLGVDWHEDDVRPVARGASGDVYGVPVTIERMKVNGIEARHVQAIVVPKDLDISLLGQTFLSKINRVEVTSDEMVLHD